MREQEPGFWERRRSRRSVLAGGLAATGVVSLAACTSSTTTPTLAPTAAAPAAASPTAVRGAAAPAATATPAAPAAKYGGILQLIGVAAPHFDPQMTSTTALLGQPPGFCYSRLLRYRVGADVPQPSFVVTGDLADSWTQPDDTTIVVKLKPNAKWHNKPPANGRAVTADDIVYSYTRQRDLKINAGLIDTVASFTAVDPQTVRLTLKQPDPDILVNLAHIAAKIVNRETVDARGDLKSGDIIGTGPWMTRDPLDPQKQGTVFKNPDYFEKGLPYMDGIQLNVITDPQTRNAALRSKQLDIDVLVSDPVTVETTRKAAPDLTLTTLNGAAPFEFGVQAGDGPTKDVRVRQAIAKAIDRQGVSDTLTNKRSKFPQMFALPDPTWGFTDSELQALFKPDLAGAKNLMTAAGQDKGFSLKTVVTNASAGVFLNVAEFLNANLKQIGIDLQIQSVDNATYSELLNRGNFEAWCGSANTLGATTANAELTSRYLTGGTRNVQKLADPKLDDMIRQQTAQGRDPEARKKTLKDIARYLAVDQPGVYPIVSTFHDWLAWPYVKNIYPGTYAQTAHWMTLLWLDK